MLQLPNPALPTAGRLPVQALRALLGAAGLVLGSPALPAQSYHSNDVTPAGSNSGKLNGTGGGRQVGGAQVAAGSPHAVLLSGNALSAVDLHPAAGYYYSMATCADDSQQGGWGYALTGGVHALVWNGSSASYADLNPSGYNFSYCLGVHGGQQVGYAQSQSYFVTASHAMLWTGSAGSAVDLHPGTAAFSRAMGVCNGEQVGYVSGAAYPDGESLGYHNTSRAVRWNGSAASAVDLHPAGFDASEALCTSGTRQGGWGYSALAAVKLRALLWSGTAESVLDLHPAGYSESRITAMSATMQVGEGWVGAPGTLGAVRHALAWSGSADSVVDLNQYLPPGYLHAVATGIDDRGNVVGYAYNTYIAGITMPPDAVAVVFAPGAAPAAGLAGLALNPARVAPGGTVEATVTLGAPAPAGGVALSFLSTNPGVAPAPASFVLPEGLSSATVALPVGGATLTVPTSLKVYATDGAVSRAASLSVVPVVTLASISANPVEGGFSTYGSVTLRIPAQAGGAVVSLASGNPALVAVPPTVTIPLGYTSLSFAVNTAAVTTLTPVTITATLGGNSVSSTVTLNPAPVVALAALTAPGMVGGQSVTGTVTLNNFVRAAEGAVIALSSGDAATLQVPATVTVPKGATSVTFPVTTNVVNGLKGVSIRASYNGSVLTTNVTVDPIPTVTISQADYVLDTQMLKVQANTSYANSILTYGTDVSGAPIGTMQFEAGLFKGSIVLPSAPATVTVWNSNGGSATMTVTVKTGTGGNSTGGGGGGGGGGSTTTAMYKLVTKTVGKGSVTLSPAAATYAAGTKVTLTAVPDAGSPWNGWSGDATGTARTITVTMTKDLTLSANFK